MTQFLRLAVKQKRTARWWSYVSACEKFDGCSFYLVRARLHNAPALCIMEILCTHAARCVIWMTRAMCAWRGVSAQNLKSCVFVFAFSMCVFDEPLIGWNCARRTDGVWHALFWYAFDIYGFWGVPFDTFGGEIALECVRMMDKQMIGNLGLKFQRFLNTLITLRNMCSVNDF